MSKDHLVRKDLTDVNGVATHRMVKPQAEASEQTRQKVADAAVRTTADPRSTYQGVSISSTTAPASNPYWFFGSSDNAHDVITTLTHEGKSVTFPPMTQGKSVARDDTRAFLAMAAEDYDRYLRADPLTERTAEESYYDHRDAQTAEAIVELFGWDHSVLRMAAIETAEDNGSWEQDEDVDWIDDGPLGYDPEVEVGQDFTYEGMLVRVSQLNPDKKTLLAQVTNPGSSGHAVGTSLFITVDALDEARGIETAATRDYASIAEGHYLQAIVDDEDDDEGNPLSDNYDFWAFDEESVKAASADLRAFVARHYGDLHDMEEANFAKAYFGSRTESGLGFWEMGDDPKFKRLDEAARKDGSFVVDVNENGLRLI